VAAIQNLYRLQFGGLLFLEEQWSCTLHVNSPQILPDSLAGDLFDPIAAWMSRGTSHNAIDAHLQFVKFNKIDPATGKQGAGESFQQTGSAIGANDGAPGQLTLAVSLTTALARGRGHAGRMYPPNCSAALAAVDEAGQVPTGTADDIAQSAKTLIEDINTVCAVGAKVCVFSAVGQSQEPITGVRVGHVVDTQRRRRRSLRENYPAVVAIP